MIEFEMAPQAYENCRLSESYFIWPLKQSLRKKLVHLFSSLILIENV